MATISSSYWNRYDSVPILSPWNALSLSTHFLILTVSPSSSTKYHSLLFSIPLGHLFVWLVSCFAFISCILLQFSKDSVWHIGYRKLNSRQQMYLKQSRFIGFAIINLVAIPWSYLNLHNVISQLLGLHFEIPYLYLFILLRCFCHTLVCFCLANAERSAIEMNQCNTIQYNTMCDLWLSCWHHELHDGWSVL